MFEHRVPQAKETFVLGAGFSHALSEEMPLTDELGNSILERLGRTLDAPFAGGSFETWLSRLAEHQPDLSFAENMENQARFARISELLAQLLT